VKKLIEKIALLKFRILVLPKDNHSKIPTTVIGFRSGVLFLLSVFLVFFIVAFILFRFTLFNDLVNVNAELSQQDIKTIRSLNAKVLVLATELERIKKENSKLNFVLTLKDSASTVESDSLKKVRKIKDGEKAVQAKQQSQKKTMVKPKGK
jgi:hypothetical protein